MSFFSSLDVSASGLTAQRLRMDVIAENIANANTTRTGNGGPYRRKVVLFEEQGAPTRFQTIFNRVLNRPEHGNGVKVTRITEDRHQGPRVYEPNHPDADADGYVTMPNVNIVVEMVNMMSANRSYEANITAANVTQNMLQRTLDLSRQ